jgi:hypothetical protein
MDCQKSEYNKVMTNGVIYMAFGERAAAMAAHSVDTLRASGSQPLPVAVVGDTPVPGAEFIEWRGESPFNPSFDPRFRFLAGRVKPSLYNLSPFDVTLYADADTEFVKPIDDGFDLGDYDVAVAEENQQLCMLHNNRGGLWYYDRPEVLWTIKTVGSPYASMINSGIIFFRKSETCKALFDGWRDEWMCWQQWDEQMALLRAIHNNPNTRVKMLPSRWNSPRLRDDTIIYHACAAGGARAAMI